MAYCFMSTEKIKSIGAFTRKYEHNYRTGNVPNADINRKHLNEEIIALPEGKTYADAFRNKMAELGHNPRANAVLGVELVMTYNSREVDGQFDIDAWKEANVKWLKEQFPPDCILSVVMHRDEGPDNGRSAHLHAIVLPIHERKLNCKHYLSGRKKLIDLQDSYGKAMEPLGLERGLKGSSAKHEDIRKFYDSLNKAVNVKLPEPEEDETLEEYYVRANQYFSDAGAQNLEKVKKLEREITELQTKVKMANFEAKVDAREDIKEANKLKKEAEELKAKALKESKEIEEKSKELRDTEARLRNFNALMNGLKNHPDKQFTDGLGEDIQTLIEWEEEYEKSLDEKLEKEQEDIRDELFG